MAETINQALLWASRYLHRPHPNGLNLVLVIYRTSLLCTLIDKQIYQHSNLQGIAMRTTKNGKEDQKQKRTKEREGKK